MALRAPSLQLERSFMGQGYRFIAGMDEVGRGALAGPVSVGVVVLDMIKVAGISGVRDSKLLSAQLRDSLVAPIKRWAVASAVGHASAEEIDSHGITAALRFAGRRALEAVHPRCAVDLVLLDGHHDWLSSPAHPSLLDSLGEADDFQLPVRTQIKADMQCLSVAAASVLAKVERDAIMASLAAEYSGYGWESNKGYGSAKHLKGIDTLGPSPYHRTSWKIFR